MDPNVPLGMNIMLIIANILNLVYNIPQMVQTYRSRSTRDFSGWFLSLRIVGNGIWLVYSIYVANLLMLLNNLVSVLASVFIGYYKLAEINREKNNKKLNGFKKYTAAIPGRQIIYDDEDGNTVHLIATD